MAVANIKELREQAGLSQAELARRAGVTRAAVSQWERGHTKSLTTKSLVKVAAALGVEPISMMASEAEDLPIPPHEWKLLRQFRALSQREQRAVLGLIVALLGQDET